MVDWSPPRMNTPEAYKNVGSATHRRRSGYGAQEAVPTWQAGSPRRRDLRPALRAV